MISAPEVNSVVDDGGNGNAAEQAVRPIEAAGQQAPSAHLATPPRVWGLTPTQLHDRYWASRGVQVVRQGEPSEIVDGAELFLLTDPSSLAVFKLGRLVEKLFWDQPDVLCVRLHDERERGYSERVVTDPLSKRFVRFERLYGGSDSRVTRMALTRDRAIARAWQSATEPRVGWRRLRQSVPVQYRATVSLKGSVYDRAMDDEVMQFMRNLVQVWHRPDSTIRRAKEYSGKRSNGNGKIAPTTGWVDEDAHVAESVQLVGPVWVGAGRKLNGETPAVIGPAVLWDDASARPAVESLVWGEIEPTSPATFSRAVQPRPISSLGRASKRAFDVAFAMVALLLTLPLYPLVMLAIWLEDGRPFFFAHKRETMGGKEFPCIKFRSMRKDAEQIKAELQQHNQADGPQFYMDFDPRLTRVGRLLRMTNIDELPQFINVLLGHMSVVGPRPSPQSENQYCPPWREARLSVRPGITGLWQVRRTRVRGLDFQEWIKYDIEYVENRSWRMDLGIIRETIVTLVRGITRS